MHIEPYAVAVPDAVLDDLRQRLRRTRWPEPAPGEAWSQGVDLDYLDWPPGCWTSGAPGPAAAATSTAASAVTPSWRC
ncbi:epoxide hydrolase N-terminal domain-containing protein [Actinacidiphila paucisporea]|uniref:epoxide hydrolase N-terminal domain-containing protein n=1 Tax=Actinacidiphila paucisporea TaxID=310782 RepID=UPI00190EE76B